MKNFEFFNSYVETKLKGFLIPIRASWYFLVLYLLKPFSFISKVTIRYSRNLGQDLSYVSKLGFLVDDRTPNDTISCLLIDDEFVFWFSNFYSVLTFLLDWKNNAWISQNKLSGFGGAKNFQFQCQNTNYYPHFSARNSIRVHNYI